MAKEEQSLLGSNSFWEMSQLAMAGKLASCQSCVEFWYFQSRQNAVAFLDSCAAGGLVERVSLIDLHGDLESISVSGPTQRQESYDQAIYISAPTFRKQNLDAARDKIEGTKNAVYEAFHLYLEILEENDEAIKRAYLTAVAEEKLRRSKVAKERLDVDLSPVAKLRLIKDGYRYWIGRNNPDMSRSKVDKQATEQTISFVLDHSEGAPVPSRGLSDHASELEDFIFEFLGDRRYLEPFWQGEDGARFHLFLFPVVNELIRVRVNTLRDQDDSNKANEFDKAIRHKIHAAKKRERKNPAYIAALDEILEDLARYVSNAPTPIPSATPYSTEIRL